MTRESREAIKQAARKAGVSIKHLIAMSPGRDPFYVGSENDYAKATWFREMWEKFGSEGLHLRGMHYILQAPKDIVRPDGQLYMNTDKCWGYLKTTFLLARHLNEVPFGAFQDFRTPPGDYWSDDSFPYEEPQWVDPKNRIEGVDFAPSIEWEDAEDFADKEAERLVDEIFMYVYYNQRRWQPYYLSVWSEKRFPEIEEACKGKANYIPNIGTASAEHANKELQRILEFGKPAVVFYMSDFDPRGMDMPMSVSRLLEARSGEDAPRIRVFRLAVTPEQVIEYQIPRSPIKKGKAETPSGRGAKAYNTVRDVFQSVFGEGAVEMDAVFALHKGELGRWVQEALNPWVDHELEKRVEDAVEEFRKTVKDRIKEIFLEKSEDIDNIRERIGEKVDSLADIHKKTIEESKLDEDMEELKEILNALEFDLDVDDLDIDDGSAPGEDRDWLLDTSRTYAEQIQAYKNYDMRYKKVD